MAKFQVSMDDELFRRIEDYADRNYITRSGAIALACNQLVMADDMRQAICDMAVSMARIAESNEIDEQAKEDLKAFHTLAKMFSGNAKK